MIIILLFLILPILLSGLTFIAILSIKLPSWTIFPLDFGLLYKSKRIFGRNKTIKGPMCMTLFSVVYAIIIYRFIQPYLPFYITLKQVVITFFFAGLAYSLGELPNSFIKRQRSIEPGERSPNVTESKLFTIIDNFDSLFAIAIIYWAMLPISIPFLLLSVLVGGILHIGTNILMKRIGLKK